MRSDLVIDGGNSFYLDSEENGLTLDQKKINFMGMGVSVVKKEQERSSNNGWL